MNAFPALIEDWTLPDGSTATVTITVNEEAIPWLVDRAARNRGRRAKSGPVTVKLTDVRPPPPALEQN